MRNSSELSSSPPVARRLVTCFVAAEALSLIGNLVVRLCQRNELLPEWAVTVVALGAAAPMVLFAVYFVRMLRTDMDEMLQRIVLEGLSFAMVVFVPLAGLYVNARTAGLIRAELDPPELLLIPSILAVVGILIAWSRLK